MFSIAKHALVLASALALALVPPVLAADGPRPLTFHDFVSQNVEYNRKTLVEAYKEAGKRDPKWDDAAIKYLEALSVQWGNVGQPRLYTQENVPTLKEVVELGEAALKAGCDDPLVRYTLGRKLNDLDKGPSQRSSQLVLESQADLLASKYSAYRKHAATAAARDLTPDPEQRKTLNAKAADLMIQSLTEPIVNDSHRRRLLRELQEQLEAMGAEDAAYYDRIINEAGADAWVVAMLAGERHIKEAWKARGGGFANTVTEEGWKGFAEHLKKAEEQFMKAVRARPHLPDAFTMMITVSMGRSDGRHRAWFDKAVAAQLDYTDAYNRVYTAMLPRWGGSYVEMLEVGINAARTGRYDTLAPLQFITAVSRVTGDNQRGGGKWDVWSNPETYKIAADVFNNYAEKLRPQQGAGWYRTYHAAVAWRIGKFDEARKQLELAGDRVELSAFDNVEAPGDLAVSQIYGLTGPQAADYTRAVDLYDAGRFNDALDLFKQTAAKLPADDKGQLYLRDRVFLLGNPVQFAGGEWVDLMPKTGRLTGWQAVAGQWEMEKAGTIIGRSDTSGLALVYQADFGRRYEVIAKVEILTPETTTPPRAGGVFVGITKPETMESFGVWPDLAKGMVAVRNVYGVGQLQGVQGVVNKTNTIHVTLWDTRMTASVNDKPLEINGEQAAGAFTASTVGAGTFTFRRPGHSIRVHEFKVRKLDKEPGVNQK